MRPDDWITNLYIMEQIKQKFYVPERFAWLDYNFFEDVEWHENVKNYTEEQCLLMADVISKEFKEVEQVYDQTKFLNQFYNDENN